MQTKILIPHSFKPLGWFLLLLGTAVGIVLLLFDLEAPALFKLRFPAFYSDGQFISDLRTEKTYFFNLIENNLLDEITGSLILIGGFFVAFSRQKVEDEFIFRIRLESLLWATYIYLGFTLLGLWLFFGLPYFNVMIVNMFAILYFFIIRFHLVLAINKGRNSDEE